MTDLTAPARNANLNDLVALLQGQQTNKLDVVVPATKIRSQGGMWVIDDIDAELGPDGVTTRPGTFRPTEVADEGIADKLGIPLAYVRKMRATRPDLYDANVNGLLHGRVKVTATGREVVHPADDRKFLVRAFRNPEGGPGVARAMLSDGYRVIDNLDVLVAALDGIRDAGVDVTFDGCDLTERRMRVRVVAPAVEALAPVLLEGYRSPFGNGARRVGPAPWETAEGLAHGWLRPDDRPVVFAGFEIANSETGGGAFTLTPRLVVKVCRNGLTITADALRNVHLGAKMDAGIVRWSEETRRANLELVAKQARDAVSTFLDVEYVKSKVADIEAKAGKVLDKPAEQVEIVTNRLKIAEGHAKLVLDHFLRGGQLTAGGVMHAVTSAAQSIDDAEAAADLEALGLRALEVAAAL
jgi:hypothetical protein